MSLQTIKSEALQFIPELTQNRGVIINTENITKGSFPISNHQIARIAKLLNEIYDEIEENLSEEQYEDFEDNQPFSEFITTLCYHNNLTEEA